MHGGWAGCVGSDSLTATAVSITGRTDGRLTLLVSVMLTATYEWSHFIIYTPYRPKSRYYRSIWRSHRLHHFKNEHYWFGVSSDAADRLLGTNPDHRTVPKSETVKTLGMGA